MTQDQQAVAWMYEHNGCKNVYAYQLPDWSPAKGTETPLYATPKSSEGELLDSALGALRAACAWMDRALPATDEATDYLNEEGWNELETIAQKCADVLEAVAKAGKAQS